MSIIDQIGKKVSKAATTATQKSSDLIDVTKLNANISREEKEINNLYTQIGQECFRLYKEDTQLPDKLLVLPDELLVLCEEIAAHFATIDSFKQEISGKKGIVICSNCGKESPRGTSFCGDCGSKLMQEEDNKDEEVPPIESDAKKCPNCEAELEEGVKFCVKCGSQIE